MTKTSPSSWPTERVGTVSDVQNGQARVTPDENADLTEVVKSALGWGDADDTHDLQNDDIENVTDEEVSPPQPIVLLCTRYLLSSEE